MTYTQEIEQDFANIWHRAYDNYNALVFDCSLFNYTNSKYVVLDCIRIKEDFKRRGFGTEIMLMLCKYADFYELPIYLDPNDLFGTPLDVLNRFYAKFGFKKNWFRQTPLEYRKYLCREPINDYICEEFIKNGKKEWQRKKRQNRKR